MKRICTFSIIHLVLFGFLLTLTNSCKTEVDPKLLPVLTTSAVTNITQNTATTGGIITSDNGLDITARGVCWSLKPNPTIKDSLSKNAAGTGEFVSNISNLIADTIYYVRAYATNSDGTAYGLQVTFKTLISVMPVLSTTTATNISVSTASSGGNIIFNGGSVVLSRGVCWSKNPNPTIINDKTSDGSGNGIFTSILTNLQSGSTYYVRSYTTNSIGTAYGSQVSLTTQNGIIILTTTPISTITTTSSTSGGNITSDGGAAVTDRGVCWTTDQTPTITNSKTTDGTGAGSFTSAITGLTTNTTYSCPK
ncbi:MAG: hypothetical protein Q7U47_04670 [Paludibacter sp.]|nr:hypothetical protein [Paludibacter sp.]